MSKNSKKIIFGFGLPPVEIWHEVCKFPTHIWARDFVAAKIRSAYGAEKIENFYCMHQNCQVIGNLKNQNSNPKKAQNSIQIPDNFIFAENIFWQFFKSRVIENMTTWTSNRNFMSRKMWKFNGFKVKSYKGTFNFRKNDNLREFRNAYVWGISWLVKTVIDKCQSMSATFIQFGKSFRCSGSFFFIIHYSDKTTKMIFSSNRNSFWWSQRVRKIVKDRHSAKKIVKSKHDHGVHFSKNCRFAKKF